MNTEIKKVKKENERIGVFITGATGFVGSNLVNHLLLEDNYKLFCLVRPHKGDPKKRLIETVSRAAETAGLSSKDISSKFENLIAVTGDLTKPSLGISETEMQLMHDFGIDHLWHAAAYIKHDEFFRKEIFAVNVDGTRNVVELAKSLKISEINHISTAYVAGKRSGNIDEVPYDGTIEANNCYEESKREAEDIVLSASKQGLFHLRIFRPSTIIGNSKTYKANSQSEFYAFMGALQRYIEMVQNRIEDHYENNPFFIYAEEEASLNLIPIDTFIAEAVSTANEKKQSPEIHHITNPFPVSGDDFMAALKKSIFGISFKLTSNDENLNVVDEHFQKKVELSNTPFINNLRFEPHKYMNNFSRKLKLKVSDLVMHIDKYMVDYRKKRKIYKDESNRKFLEYDKTTITGRFGKQLVYYKTGEGPAIVLHCAYGHKRESFKYLINNLSKHFTIFHWDYRGLKNSDLPNADFVWGAEEHADDIKEMLDNENIDQCHLIACCAGVTNTLKFYEKYPSYVESLIYINGVLVINEAAQILAKSEQAGHIKLMIDSLMSDPESASDFVAIFQALINDEIPVETLIQKMEKVPSEYADIVFGNYLNEEFLVNFVKQESAWMNLDGEKLLANVDIPTLLISGDLDRILLPEVSKVIANKINNSYYYNMPASDHNLILESQEECTELLSTFLKKRFLKLS